MFSVTCRLLGGHATLHAQFDPRGEVTKYVSSCITGDRFCASMRQETPIALEARRAATPARVEFLRPRRAIVGPRRIAFRSISRATTSTGPVGPGEAGGERTREGRKHSWPAPAHQRLWLRGENPLAPRDNAICIPIPRARKTTARAHGRRFLLLPPLPPHGTAAISPGHRRAPPKCAPA